MEFLAKNQRMKRTEPNPISKMKRSCFVSSRVEFFSPSKLPSVVESRWWRLSGTNWPASHSDPNSLRSNRAIRGSWRIVEDRDETINGDATGGETGGGMMRTPPVSPPARPALITHTNFSFFSLSLSFLLSVLHHTRSFLAFPITLQITDRRNTRSIHDTIILRTKKLRDERTNERTNERMSIYTRYLSPLLSILSEFLEKKKNIQKTGDYLPEEIPQIVLLTFDDSVNDLNKGLYADLFEKGRKNPNGCPISATFYVSHEWTDYSQVQNLYAAGHEIASHTVS